MGLRLEAIPTRDLPKKTLKKNMQPIKCYHFRWSLQKNHEKRLLQTAPTLVKLNEQSLTNVKFIWISSHPQKMV